MRILIAAAMVAIGAHAADGPAFAVASVKPSARLVGKDYRKPLTVAPDRLSGRNVSLKDLLVEAYGMEPFRISGPGWLDENEYDVEARADGPVTRERMRGMLQRLLTERFQIKSRTERKEARVHALVVDRGGPKIHPGAGTGSFHGDMRRLAQLISIQLTIPAILDPTRPSIASGTPAPVVDKTGLAGEYDLNVDPGSPGDGDMFQLWQRKLQEFGLKLENQRANVDFLVVERAEKVPTAN